MERIGMSSDPIIKERSFADLKRNDDLNGEHVFEHESQKFLWTRLLTTKLKLFLQKSTHEEISELIKYAQIYVKEENSGV